MWTSLPQSNSEFRPLGSDGIADHSSDERYVIVSPDDQTPIGLKAFKQFLEDHEIGNTYSLGSYKGVVEGGFIINARDWDTLKASGLVSDQQVVLYLWPMSYGYAEYGRKLRKATMFFKDGTREELGTIQRINESELPADVDWTFTDGYFWITKK